MQLSRLEQFKHFKQVYGITTDLGFIETYISGVNFFWSEKTIDFSSMVYPSGIALIRNGRKVGIFDRELFHYDKDHFLLITASTPLICKTIATAEEPVFGIFLQSNCAEIRQMVMDMGGKSALPHSSSRGVEPVTIAAELEETVERLMQILLSEQESKVIGQSVLKEAVFRVLQSEHGRSLFAAMQSNTTQHKLIEIIEYIRNHFSDKISVESLATRCNMSTSRFHKEFKNMTGSSPIQFIKRIRLSKARSLITHDNKNVSTAAVEVGYTNLSQFHRDFKAYFKATPTDAASTGYSEIDAWPHNETAPRPTQVKS